MKKVYKSILLGGLLIASTTTKSQTISTFDEMILAPTSFYDGSDYSWGFNTGNAHFYNYYDTSFGASFGYWAQGWAVSNIYDTVTQASSFTQLFNAKEVISSVDPNFGIGTQGSRIVLTGAAIGKVVNGFSITNSTYAFNSMKLGDGFAKKFGGPSGNDPDYFKLVVKKYLGGVLGADSVVFFLADYRDSVNTNDYIVENWTWVNLIPLGNVDSLEFTLRSTDVGGFGINTPLYYCIENFETANSPVGIAETKNDATISVYPNPIINIINIQSGEINSTAILTDVNGKVLISSRFNFSTSIDATGLSKGIYFLGVNGVTTKLIK